MKVLTDAIAGIKSQATSEDNSNALAILYEQLGHAYREQQKYPEAVQTYQRNGEARPGFAKARAAAFDRHLSRQPPDRCRHRRSEEGARRFAEGSRPDRFARDALWRKIRQRRKARNSSKGLLQGNESDQEIYIDIAQVQERGKQYAEAEQSAAEGRADVAQTAWRKGNRLVHAWRHLRAPEEIRIWPSSNSAKCST